MAGIEISGIECPPKDKFRELRPAKGQISGIEPRQICLLSVCSSHVLTNGRLNGPSPTIFSRQKMSVAKKGKFKASDLRPHPNKDKKYHHRRHIASRWSPCWSLTAAGGTIGKSIVLCFFSYPGFVYTTGVSGNTSIFPLLSSSR